MDEQRLERALRQGPPFAARYIARLPVLDESLVARRPAGVARLAMLIAVTALLLVGMLAGLAALGALRGDKPGAENGWVAFALWDGDTSERLPDRDIYFVRHGQAAERVIGTDFDNLDQICPAFSPDGRRLAYGQAEGRGETFDVSSSGLPIGDDATYRHAELVIVNIDADGNASGSETIEVGGSFPPPCATWSADGQRVAFGVSTTSWNHPERSDADSEVWVVGVANAEIDMVSDTFATDLAWSPEGSDLAIASHDAGRSLRDGAISLYSPGDGQIRTLVAPSGVTRLSWSPDGSRIVSQRGERVEWLLGPRPEGGMSLWVTELDGSESLLASGFETDHGIGPEWSPTGEWIVYQPTCDRSHTLPDVAPCREESDVVLIPTEGEFEGRTPGDGEVVIPHLDLPGDDGSVARSPFRVTWSPDGKQLLYLTFGGPTLIAVPIDAGSPPVVLFDSDDSEGGRAISVYGGDGLLPTQSWGHRREE